MVISYCYGNMEMDEMANNSLLTYIYHTSIIYHIITTAWCSMCADPSDVPIQRTGVLTSNNLTWTVERWTHFFRPCQTSVFEAVAHHFPSESPAISSHLQPSPPWLSRVDWGEFRELYLHHPWWNTCDPRVGSNCRGETPRVGGCWWQEFEILWFKVYIGISRTSKIRRFETLKGLEGMRWFWLLDFNIIDIFNMLHDLCCKIADILQLQDNRWPTSIHTPCHMFFHVNYIKYVSHLIHGIDVPCRFITSEITMTMENV
jgi:hypothetical protein